MSDIMTPSEKTMTPGQIDKAVDTLTSAFRSELRANSAKYGAEAAQIVLGQRDLGAALLVPFADRIADAQKDVARKAMLASLAKNEHGHYTFDITGLDLTGEAEVARLTGDNYRVSDWAKLCLTSTKKDGYDANHRLGHCQSYKIVLVFGREIKSDAERTTKGIQDFAAKFGYQKPKAGIVPRIRETVSDEFMKGLDIDYIAALHDPITDSVGGPNVLGAYRSDEGRWVGTYWDYPGNGWGTNGAFAFVVPASASK